MRRETRKHEKNNLKTLIYVSGSIILLAILIFIIGLMVLSNKIEEDAKNSEFSTSKISDLVPNTINSSNNTKEASSEIGKTVNELKNSISNNTISSEQNNTSSQTTSKSNTQSTVKTSQEKTEETSVTEEPKVDTSKEETKDPVFIVPVEGEIIREFAKDKLVYSDTLEEWITHNGIDIKADKTTVVKAAASGKVTTIKNDPRYGLTVTIEHESGFKSVYANLLTAEFVTEGETVESGQTIGTVGNTATFEILDEAHLHFEIIKDNEYLDPNLYIK